MMQIRDLQHRFHVDGRTYVVEVCAPGKHPAPVTVGPFDVHVTADVPANFDDYDDDELENIVTQIVEYVRPLMPPVAPVEWEMFKASVCGWVCTHCAAAMIEDWHLERRGLVASAGPQTYAT